MMPMPPALETAEASGARAIQPMGAWITGISMPSMAVMRLRNCMACPWRGVMIGKSRTGAYPRLSPSRKRVVPAGLWHDLGAIGR